MDFHTNHEEKMAEASSLATYSVGIGGGPFGAIVVDNSSGIIVGRGHNQVTLNNDPTAHAEVVAIRDACTRNATFSLKDHTIYTSCEPCPMCLAAIYWARIDAVYYGNTREDAAAIGFDDAAIYEEMGKSIADQNTRKIKLLRLGEEGAREAFHAWTTLQTKTEY